MQKAEEQRLRAREAEEAAALEVAAAQAARGPVGPALKFSCVRLCMHCDMGQTATGTLCVTNSGTAAVYFSWSKHVPAFPFSSINQQDASSFYMPVQVSQSTETLSTADQQGAAQHDAHPLLAAL